MTLAEVEESLPSKPGKEKTMVTIRCLALILATILVGCSHKPPGQKAAEDYWAHDPRGVLFLAAVGYHDKTGLWPSTMDEVKQGAAVKGIKLNEGLYRNPKFSDTYGDRHGGNFHASWTWPDGTHGEMGGGIINNDFSQMSPTKPSTP